MQQCVSLLAVAVPNLLKLTAKHIGSCLFSVYASSIRTNDSELDDRSIHNLKSIRLTIRLKPASSTLADKQNTYTHVVS